MGRKTDAVEEVYTKRLTVEAGREAALSRLTVPLTAGRMKSALKASVRDSKPKKRKVTLTICRSIRDRNRTRQMQNALHALHYAVERALLHKVWNVYELQSTLGYRVPHSLVVIQSRKMLP